MPVAGLDLARRSDHSALVLLNVAPGRLTVTAALRLPQAPLRQQFALIAPHLAGLDLLVFDQSGLGDAAAELLPKTPPHIGVCLVGGDRPLTRSAQGDRLVVGKSWLVQRLGAAMRSGVLTVAEKAPGRELLRKSLLSSSSGREHEVNSVWRRLAAMTILSSRRHSPCWRQILRTLAEPQRAPRDLLSTRRGPKSGGVQFCGASKSPRQSRPSSKASRSLRMFAFQRRGSK